MMEPGATLPPHFCADAQIEYIGTQVLAGTLPKAEWTHAAHLAAAAWVIAVRKDLQPARDMPGIISAYNLASGVANTDTGGYHETITQASLLAVAAFVDAQAPGTPLHIVCNRLLASPYGNKDWLLRHWTPAVLFSTAARRNWVPPDIAPLSFPP
jgi:hypothetical protein